MEWTVSVLSGQKIVVIQTQGVADEADSLKMAKSIAETMAEYNAERCLIDHSAIHSVTGAVVKIYYRPQELREVGIPSKVRIAEAVLPAHKAHFDFFETVCRNRGFDFRIFNERESAIQWLVS